MSEFSSVALCVDKIKDDLLFGDFICLCCICLSAVVVKHRTFAKIDSVSAR